MCFLLVEIVTGRMVQQMLCSWEGDCRSVMLYKHNSIAVCRVSGLKAEDEYITYS